MKKVLIAVVGIIVVAGFIVGKMMYDKQRFEQKIDDLSTFEPPEDFSLLLSKENLKQEKAPIYDFRMQGERIVPEMIEVIRNTSLPESARLGAIIVVSHLQAKEAVDDVIESLRSTEGRLSECASVFLQLYPYEAVPEKIRKVAENGKLDKTIRLNAYRAMYNWASRKLSASDKLKRRRNEDLKALALSGIEEEDQDLRKIAVDILPHVSFKREAPEGEVAEVNKVVDSIIPFLQHEDEDLRERAYKSLRFLVGEMFHTTDALPLVLPLAKNADREIRLRAAELIKMIYKDEESTSRKVMEKVYFLLDDEDKDIVMVGIDILAKHGRSTEDRLALKDVAASDDEEIAKAAAEAQKAILEAEKD